MVVDQHKHIHELEEEDDEEMLYDVEVQNRCNRRHQQNDREDHELHVRRVEDPK